MKVKMEVLAFVRISDGTIFCKFPDGTFAMKGHEMHSLFYTEERLSIVEFLPIFLEEQIGIYSEYFANCGKNTDYIPECDVCGMSVYLCLCSHDD